MIVTVDHYTIDISQLEALTYEESGENWKSCVILTLKPTLQYVQHPESKEWELQSANTIIRQPCLCAESMMGKYDKWIKAWEEYKEGCHE